MKINLNEYESGKSEPFYEWHANVFYYNRKKCVILMNNLTRYCITLFDIKAKDFKQFYQIVLNSIKETFLAEGFLEKQVNKYIENCGVIDFTKTHDRSILSQINQFIIDISWQIEEYLPSEQLNLVELNQWTGNLISLTLKGFPIDHLKNEMSKIET